MPKLFISLCCMLVCICFACGGDKKENNLGGAGASGSDETSSIIGPASADSDGSDVKANDTGKPSVTPTCGNKTVEGLEECDDGDKDDTDGCTSLCTYTCHKDSDCANDPCSGAGAVCDTKNTYVCTSGAGKKADGERCGDHRSCYRGSCVENACNNGIKQPGEECDDGDQDERNGCTTKCKYSCVTGNKDYPKCANDCDVDATCDDATRRCVAESRLPITRSAKTALVTARTADASLRFAETASGNPTRSAMKVSRTEYRLRLHGQMHAHDLRKRCDRRQGTVRRRQYDLTRRLRFQLQTRDCLSRGNDNHVVRSGAGFLRIFHEQSAKS